jgi:hypothetical protein
MMIQISRVRAEDKTYPDEELVMIQISGVRADDDTYVRSKSR